MTKILSDGTQQRIHRRIKPTVVTTTHKVAVGEEVIDNDNPSSPIM